MPITKDALKRRLDQALGRARADLVIKGARVLDVATGDLLPGDVAVAGGLVVGICDEYDGEQIIDGAGAVVVPGFIDTHLHIESTCVTPDEFERCALPRGTTTAICDPHEMANVLGTAGIEYFLAASERLTLDLRVQLSSCVPSTAFETAGARLRAADLVPYRNHPKVIGLAEFMSSAEIFAHDDDALDKLVAFDGAHIDGHAPLLTGRELNAYAACGIKNCHETTRADEALEKLHKGLQVLIRDGSVSKDVDTLAPLLTDLTSPFMAFCTDDRNPLDIAEEGHLDRLIRKAIARGAPVAAAYRAATWSAAAGFGLKDRGRVAPGYRADLVLVDDLTACAVRQVLKDGVPVTDETFAHSGRPPAIGYGSIKLDPVGEESFRAAGEGSTAPVIGLIPGSIITEHLRLALPQRNGVRDADPTHDVLKLAVFARHGTNRNVGRGFVKGFGLAAGALASSVGHDSHNVIVVGRTDAEMALAVNRLIEIGGGFVAAAGGRIAAELPLPVIPHLKITDRGLVDVDRHALIAA
jgi:adenine deaminase